MRFAGYVLSERPDKHRNDGNETDAEQAGERYFHCFGHCLQAHTSNQISDSLKDV
jgi:hypothetical protein